MIRKQFWFVIMALFVAGLTSCSDDDSTPEAPLDPPALEEKVVDLKPVGYNQYIGGDKLGQGLANYYMLLSNTTCGGEGSVPMPMADGDMLVLDLYGTTAADQENIAIPEGSYKFGVRYDKFTFNVDNTLIVRNKNGKIEYLAVTDGEVEVSYPSGKCDMICSFLLATGEKISYRFTGGLEFEDITDSYGSDSTLKEDMIDTKFTNAEAIYFGNLFDTKTGNFMVYLYTEGFADNMNQPGSMVALCLFSQLANDPNKSDIKEGVYTVTPREEGIGAEWSALIGLNINGIDFGTYALQVSESGYRGVGYIASGTIEVSKDNNNTYTFKYDLMTDNRKKVSGSFTTTLTIDNQAEDDTDVFYSNLEDDVDTNLPNVKEGTYSFAGREVTDSGKEIDRWALWLHAQEGDLMVMEFCTELGFDGKIPEGTYKIADRLWPNKFTTSSVISGYLWEGGGYRGTWYQHYEEGKYYVMDLLAPAIEGEVTVKHEGDNHTFEWSFIDDAPAAHQITGKWTGPIRAYDPDKDQKSVAPRLPKSAGFSMDDFRQALRNHHQGAFKITRP